MVDVSATWPIAGPLESGIISKPWRKREREEERAGDGKHNWN